MHNAGKAFRNASMTRGRNLYRLINSGKRRRNIAVLSVGIC
jgi:hypothetical protein